MGSPLSSGPFQPPLGAELAHIGQRIRQRRKAMKVSTQVASESAGLSRMTWYRLERGENTVTLSGLLSALSVLGLSLHVAQSKGVGQAQATSAPYVSDMSLVATSSSEPSLQVPVHVELGLYPQLQALSWHVPNANQLTAREALGVYQRHRRHLQPEVLMEHERRLIEGLEQIFDEPGSVL